jgi:hypothetical membrane protein
LAKLGPLVHRAARRGGALFVLGSLQFIFAMAIVQAKYPGYSLSANYISDLGSASSPWAWLFNDSIRLLGLFALLGAFWVRTAFPPKTSARVGLLLLGIAGLGAIGVGSFPEGSPQLGGNIHGVVSLVTFLGSGFALLALALGMLRDTRWDGFRAYTFLSGLVTVIALGLFVGNAFVGLGPGGMERLIVAPILLWALVAGTHLLRLPVYSPVSISQPLAV